MNHRPRGFHEDPSGFIPSLPAGKRLLGLDIGEKTIGLAMSDTSRTIASPLHTIMRRKFSTDLASLKQVLAEHDIGGIVAGMPLNMDGSIGARGQSVRQFIHNMTKELTIPILLWDERLSTAAVTRMMLEADLSRGRRDELVDKLAASYILQGFIDYLPKE